MSVSTPYGELVAPASDGDEAPLEYRFDSEVALPVRRDRAEIGLRSG